MPCARPACASEIHVVVFRPAACTLASARFISSFWKITVKLDKTKERGSRSDFCMGVSAGRETVGAHTSSSRGAVGRNDGGLERVILLALC